jgi:GNAT superfamily N-acetyltransferase
VQIRRVEALTEGEHEQLFGWDANVFGGAHLGLTYRPKTTHFLLYADGRLASHVGLLRHVIGADGHDATVVGLGGVVTVPDAQHKGYARALVAHAMTIANDGRADGGLLFCLPCLVPFYEYAGWQLVDGPVLIEQPQATMLSPLAVMVLPWSERLRGITRIDLRSLPW